MNDDPPTDRTDSETTNSIAARFSMTFSIEWREKDQTYGTTYYKEHVPFPFLDKPTPKVKRLKALHEQSQLRGMVAEVKGHLKALPEVATAAIGSVQARASTG